MVRLSWCVRDLRSHHGLGIAMNYGYIRVSTEHQDASAEAQEAKLAPLCDRVFCDAQVSGSVPLRDRPQGKELWSLLRDGDTVVITTRDRAFRSLLDAVQTLQHWRERGVRLKILDFPIDLSSDEGEMMFQVLTVFAQYERTQVKRRTKAVLAHKRATCQPYGHLRPYGYRRKGSGWVESPEERAIADLIGQLRASGMAWSRISRELCYRNVRKPHRHKKAHGYYYVQDVRALWEAAQAGYPVRPQGSWRERAPEPMQPAG